MRVTHWIVGYDPATEHVAWRAEIPERTLETVKRIARIDADDALALGTYSLEEAQLRDVLDAVGASRPTAQLDYFLEAFASPLDEPARRESAAVARTGRSRS